MPHPLPHTHRELSKDTRGYTLGNFDCWHTESACDKFDVPEVCPHARQRLEKDWKSFTGFGSDFKPTWVDRGEERNHTVSLP